MKIDSLLESFLSERAQFVPQITAYHATPGKNLRSILKNGLIPNHQKNGYGSNERSGDFGYSLEALDGVYFTTKMRDVEFIAKSIDHNPIIFICKVQNRTATLDEDRLTSSIVEDQSTASFMRKEISKHGDMSPQQQNQLADVLATRIMDNIIHRKLQGHVSGKVIENVKPDLFEYLKSLANLIMQNYEDVDSLEVEIRKLQLSITKKLKNLLHNSSSEGQHSFKIDQTIGFSGANKIVGIYDFNQGIGWGDLGEFERDAYHKVKSPVELINSK